MFVNYLVSLYFIYTYLSLISADASINTTDCVNKADGPIQECLLNKYHQDEYKYITDVTEKDCKTSCIQYHCVTEIIKIKCTTEEYKHYLKQFGDKFEKSDRHQCKQFKCYLGQDYLLSKALDLEVKALALVANLTALNKESLATDLKLLGERVKNIALELKATNASTGANTLLVLQTVYFWYEKRMDIECQVLLAVEETVDELITIANKLSAKIDVAVKSLGGTPCGQVMQQESNALKIVMSDLQTVKNSEAIESAGRALAKIEDRVEKELKALNIPPM